MFCSLGKPISFVYTLVFAILSFSSAPAQPGFQGNSGQNFPGNRPPNGMMGNPGVPGNPNMGNPGMRPPNFNPGPPGVMQGNAMGNPGMPGNAVGNPNMGMAGNAMGNPKSGMPGAPPGAGNVQIWSCQTCNKVVGNGPTPPKIDKCPFCGTPIGYYEDASGKHDMPESESSGDASKVLKIVLGVMAGVGILVGIIVGVVKGSAGKPKKKRKRKPILDDDDMPRKPIRDDDDDRPRRSRSRRDD